MLAIIFFGVLLVVALMKRPQKVDARVFKLLYEGEPEPVGDRLVFHCGCSCRAEDMEPGRRIKHGRMQLCAAHLNVRDALWR